MTIDQLGKMCARLMALVHGVEDVLAERYHLASTCNLFIVL